MFVVGRQDGIDLYNASNGLLNSSIIKPSSTDYRYNPRFAAFTEDGCGIVVVSVKWSRNVPYYRIEKFDLKQNGQIYRTIPRDGADSHLKLSEYGSYVAVAEHKNKDIRIRIWKTDGSDDISIPLRRAGKVHSLDLTGESAYLIAVATKDITILSIRSGGVQRTLYHKAWSVCISRDGLFLVSTARGTARLWSITQGALLATFETGRESAY